MKRKRWEEVGVNIPSGLRGEYENILKYRESIKYTSRAKLILLIIFFTQSILPLLIGSNPTIRNQPTLTKFGRCEQCTIDSMVYLMITRLINGVFVENEVTWAIDHRSTSLPGAAAKLFLYSRMN